jgi:hypothetical protein
MTDAVLLRVHSETLAQLAILSPEPKNDWTDAHAGRMITPRAKRPPDRHSHLPLHRRGGFDPPAARARRGGLCGGPRRAPTCDSGGVHCRRWGRGRHAGGRFFFAFPTAPGALAAAGKVTDALASGPIQVRAGLHTGTPLLTEEGYVGEDLHRAARIAAAGHGGQVLVSSTTAPLVDLELQDLGEHRFKDLSAPEHVFQIGDDEFPPLKTLYHTNLPIPQTRSWAGRRSSARCSRSSPEMTFACSR